MSTTSSTSSDARGRPMHFFARRRSRVNRRIAEHCSVVDMESSAFIAGGQVRGLRFAQLLYAGDSLAGEEWTAGRGRGRAAVRERALPSKRDRRAAPARRDSSVVGRLTTLRHRRLDLNNVDGPAKATTLTTSARGSFEDSRSTVG